MPLGYELCERVRCIYWREFAPLISVEPIRGSAHFSVRPSPFRPFWGLQNGHPQNGHPSENGVQCARRIAAPGSEQRLSENNFTLLGTEQTGSKLQMTHRLHTRRRRVHAQVPASFQRLVRCSPNRRPTTAGACGGCGRSLRTETRRGCRGRRSRRGRGWPRSAPARSSAGTGRARS